MRAIQLQHLGTARWHGSAYLLAIVLVLFPDASALSFCVAPMSAAGEAEKSETPKERSEELSVADRSLHERRLCLDTERVGTVLIFSPPLRLAQSRQYLSHAPRGHRLANDLLAPITC
jgi:hypothetical protein